MKNSKLLCLAVPIVAVCSYAITAWSRLPENTPAVVPTPSVAPPILQRRRAQPRARTKAAALTAKPGTATGKAPVFVQRPLANWARGTVVSHVRVPPGQRVIALTFDDGPWPDSTVRILNVLKQHKVRGTFFMVGRNVAHWPALARKVTAGGHAIGNHTYNHPSRPNGALAEIARTDAVMKKELGYAPNLFRPPYGMLRNGLAAVARRQKKAVVLWSADSTDWNRASAGSICDKVLRQSGQGGIILLHDGGGNRTATAAALPTIISTLHRRGYRFVTVPELLAMHVAAPPKVRRTTKTHRKPSRQVQMKPGVPLRQSTAHPPQGRPSLERPIQAKPLQPAKSQPRTPRISPARPQPAPTLLMHR